MEFSEAFEFVQDDLAFSHTKIILRQNSEYFYAISKQRYRLSSDIDPSTITYTPIPSSCIMPLCPTDITRVQEPLPPDYYVKRPSLLYYGDTEASSEPSILLLQEARICEILRSHPHPSIAGYFGCVVDDDRISGLCFARYGPNLMQMVRDGRQFDRTACLGTIRKGIEHLHSLGLIHGDISPFNILSDGESFVVADFDSCTLEGNEFGLKAGTKGWSKDHPKIAERELDWYGLLKIEQLLLPREISNECD